MGTLCERVMTALPNKRYSGHHKAADLEDDLGTPGREIWSKKCGQQVSDTAGGRWSRQHRTELDGEEWSVAYAPLGAKRLKSSKSSYPQNSKSCFCPWLTVRLTSAIETSDRIGDNSLMT